MSLRQALKSKFRSEKTDSEKEPDFSLPEQLQQLPMSSSGTLNDEELLTPNDDVSTEECLHAEKDCMLDSCKFCYEIQLAQLQEQLVATMLENQQLSNDLNQLKQQTAIDQITKQLEKEREKTRILTEKLHEKENKEGSRSPRLRRFARKEKHTEKSKSMEAVDYGSTPALAPEKDEWIDIAKEVTEDVRYVQLETPTQADVLPPGSGWKYRIKAWFCVWFYELLDDLTETAIEEEENDGESEGDPLTVRKLKENIMRFGSATKPIANMFDNLTFLLRWKSPGTTLLAFTVYMYTVYHGWFLPLVLFLANCQLVLNYIKHKGWFPGIHIAKKHDHEESDMGVSDKFQLVLHVARKVQNQLGYISDYCEKLKNLLLWQQTEVTAHLFLLVFATCFASCIFPANLLFTAFGLYLGIKMFIVDCIFYRFPRIQQKYDTTLRMWKALPTDAEMEKKHSRAEIDRLVLSQGIAGGQSSLTTEYQNFCELFNLPSTETPLPFWHGGRRCTLINKDKSLTSAFKNGRLYLTNSFLCFERSKTSTPKNLVLPLKSIAKIEKAKPYPWIPGGGMSLEVILDKPEKTYIFGAILNRDEAFESILEAGRKAGLLWAIHPIHQQEPDDCASKRTS